MYSEPGPKWLDVVGRDNVRVEGDRLHVMMLPVLSRKELRTRIKKEYYSAAGASVPKAIYKIPLPFWDEQSSPQSPKAIGEW